MRDAAAREERSFAEVAQALGLGLPYRLRISDQAKEVRFLHIGASCREVLGVSPETVTAQPSAFAELVEPEDRARLAVEVVNAVVDRRPLAIELRMRHPDGRTCWRRITAAPSWFADGSSEWDGLVVDITESKQLAEALTEKRRRLELAVELSGIGTFQWTREVPESIRWSDQQYDIYGLPRGSALSLQQVQAMIHPDDAPKVEAASQAAWATADHADFSIEHRIVRPSGEVRWVLQHRRIDRSMPGLTQVHGTTLDVTERRNAEERRQLQMRELAHRSKNALAVLVAMVHQAGRDADSVDGLVDVLMSRISAMARSQDLATAQDGRPLALKALLEEVLEMFDLSRFQFDPQLQTLTVRTDAVVALSLLLHELATNALKYGALSTPGGRILVTQEPAPTGSIAVAWREVGGPEVSPPARQGFGSRLIRAVLQGAGGRVEPVFAPDGFRARIELPANRRSVGLAQALN